MVEEPKVLFSPLELIKAAGIGVLKLISYLPFPVLYGLSGLLIRTKPEREDKKSVSVH